MPPKRKAVGRRRAGSVKPAAKRATRSTAKAAQAAPSKAASAPRKTTSAPRKSASARAAVRAAPAARTPATPAPRASARATPAARAVATLAPRAAARAAPAATPAVTIPPKPVYRDAYVNFTYAGPVLSVRDEIDGGIYCADTATLGGSKPTRLHFHSCTGDIYRFSPVFTRTIEQAYLNLYMQDSPGRPVKNQLRQLWDLMASFPVWIKRVVLRLGDAEYCRGQEGRKVEEHFLLDDTSFFDIRRLTMMVDVFPLLEVHAKCNAIHAEDIGQLVEFMNMYTEPRLLLIYISEFKQYLANIGVAETNGRFESAIDDIEVTQVSTTVTVKMGNVRIRFEDEFRALKFTNFII